jgi:alpha-tubulin suppressor-like RCC1 family protein
MAARVRRSHHSLCLLVAPCALTTGCLIANPDGLFFACDAGTCSYAADGALVTDTDAGGLPDAGGANDASNAPDAATALDAGVNPDSGISPDSGNETSDSGNSGFDAGPAPDSGSWGCSPGSVACQGGTQCCRVVDLSLGRAHSCAVFDDGTARCWGANAYGQIGDGLVSDAGETLPTTVGGTDQFSGLALNGDFSCAVTPAGAACWGLNNLAQLGIGSQGGHASSPTTVGVLASSPTALVAGRYHTCAISSGSLWCWGDNAYGEMGNYCTDYSPLPVPIPGLQSGVTEVAAGWGFTCAVVDGETKCWGYDCDGELGFNAGSCANGGYAGTPTPTAIPSLNGMAVTHLTANNTHACALVQGNLMCWGANESGEIGDGTYNDAFAPTLVVNAPSAVADVAAGWFHSCALTQGGVVYCWGDDENGQLGYVNSNGYGPAPASPVSTASGLGSVVVLRTGGNHSCALDSSGAVWCWGANNEGQLGDGTTNTSFVPVRVQF